MNTSTPGPRDRSGAWRRTAAIGGLALFSGAVHAAPFLYTPGDLVLVFRQSGNASDYAVNVGRIQQYNALADGTTIPVTHLSTDQLFSAFPSLNGIQWSVGGANRPPLDPGFPLQTIWVTAPRIDPEIQATPWLRKGEFVQGNAASQIEGIGINAALSSSLIPGGPNNTATGVVVPVNAPFPVGQLLGTSGNYFDTFQGNVESIAPDDFEDDPGAVSRSDLYELLPGTTAVGTLNAPGRHLGYFELTPDGTLTFNTSAPVAERPTITGITHLDGLATVSFTSTAGATYRLRSTNADGLNQPLGDWTIGPATTGNGQIQSIETAVTTDVRFFAIEQLP